MPWSSLSSRSIVPSTSRAALQLSQRSFTLGSIGTYPTRQAPQLFKRCRSSGSVQSERKNSALPLKNSVSRSRHSRYSTVATSNPSLQPNENPESSSKGNDKNVNTTDHVTLKPTMPSVNSETAQQQPQQPPPSASPSHEDLLKQRFFHAQSQNKITLPNLGSTAKIDANVMYPSDDPNAYAADNSSQTFFNGSSESSDSTSSASSSSATSNTDYDHIDYESRLNINQSLRSLQVPFDTHRFVQRLEEGGWTSSAFQTLNTVVKDHDQMQQLQQGQPQNQLQLARRHDPAEAIMERVRLLLTTRGRQLAQTCLTSGDMENQAYLFSAALSELRTEVQVRARNDAAGLQSLTTLLQREVDALDQKLKEDVERLKHDIQVDMNNRKAESREEQNNLEQEIQDLNNRFTISLSDLKTEIEQNVKWDVTRRSLLLVFGVAAIVAANLALADYMTKDGDASKVAAAAAQKEPSHAAPPPSSASASASAPASLGWSAEEKILSAMPFAALGASIGPRARILAPLVSAARSVSRLLRPSVVSIGLTRWQHTVQSFWNSPSARPNRPISSCSLRPTKHSSLSNSRRFHTNRRLPQRSISSAETHTAVLSTLSVPGTDILITLHPKSISIEADSLGLKPFHFDHVWLRDACQAPSSVHASNMQKLFHTSDIPLETELLDPHRPPQLVQPTVGPALLRLTFSQDTPVVNAFTAEFAAVSVPNDPHVSEFPVPFLLQHALPDLYSHTHMDIMAVPEPWDTHTLTHFKSLPWSVENVRSVAEAREALSTGAVKCPARIPWEALDVSITGPEETKLRDEALYALAEATIRDGFAFVTGVPTDTTATEEGPNAARLRHLAQKMGEIRNTFYGPLWDVQSKASASNIAYTNLDLGLHMDLLYFQNPPRFQFLHMLRNKVRGGASIFVDSFKVAERMWQQDRKLWKILTQVPVCFHYVNDGKHYRYTHPTFELAHDTEGHAGPPLKGSDMPRLSAVNYSPPFQSPLPLHPTAHLGTAEDRAQFYTALKRFSDLTLSEEFRYEKQMEEGECVVFDNRRVLHARKGFEWDASQTAQVKRWLKGCYVDGDAIWSTYRTLQTKLGRNRKVTTVSPLRPVTADSSRSFTTSTKNSTAAPTVTSPMGLSNFAPSSDDPTVLDARSKGAIQSSSAPISMISYRPVPPMSLSTLSKLYKQLSKFRLTSLVVLTGMAGYALCPSALTVATVSPVTTLLALTAGMTLCSAAANSLNQLVEAPYDAQMPRTRARPLPSRAMTPLHAFTFASACATTGVGLLATMVNPLTATLGAANIILYSFTYTPMKRISIANTWVGAVVGALPPLMGWAACTGTLDQPTDLGAWALAALLFAWQFPHFNALAHTLRAEYARGGYRMMAVTDPALNRRVSLRYALSMLPICTVLLPYSGIVHPIAYAAVSTPLNLFMIHAATKFWKDGTQKSAHWCFWVSLIHLPAVMLLAMGCKPGLWDGVMKFFRREETSETNGQTENKEHLA